MNERKRERGSEEECATQLVPLKRGSPEEQTGAQASSCIFAGLCFPVSEKVQYQVALGIVQI